MASIVKAEGKAKFVPTPEGGWTKRAVETLLGGPVSFHEITTPVGKHWLAVRYDGIAAELPPNFTATCMLMLPVYGDALSVPPHESRSR